MNKLLVSLMILLVGFSACKKDDEPTKNEIDLFVWAGQSNAQGRQGDAAGYPADVDDLDKDILFNWTLIDAGKSEGWTTMKAQDGVFPAGHFGAEVTFSRNLAKAGYKPAIFKYTKGATSIFQHWKKPGEGGFYDDMATDLKAAITDLESQGYTVNMKGFVWIQGESDSNSPEAAAAYADNLAGIIGGVRSVLNSNQLPVILSVDEQYFHTNDHWQTEILNAHQSMASHDDHIKFVSMYGYPKADITHLRPAGLIAQGKDLADAYQLLILGDQPTSSCTVTSDGSVASLLTQRAWGQSFKLDCSGHLSALRFSAASHLGNAATVTLHDGSDCAGDVLLTQNLNDIIIGNNTVTVPNDVYLDKEHTYYLNITSDTDTGWKINYSKTSTVIGLLRTNQNGQSNTSCNRPFPSFDMNFSVSVE